MHVDYPYHVDGRGRTAQTGEADHLRDLIEQVLFTSPGERVNRPDFGSGLLQLVFAPNSDVLAGAVEAAVQAALQQWLADRIQVEAVAVRAEESTLEVTVRYVVRQTQQRETATFTRAI